MNRDDIVMAAHKNKSRESTWQEYTDTQLEVSVEIAALSAKFYDLKDVSGHDDIAPFRKSDPGPAFPMNSFRSKGFRKKR